MTEAAESKRTNITYRVSKEQAKRLRVFAAQNDRSIQELIEEGLRLRMAGGSPAGESPFLKTAREFEKATAEEDRRVLAELMSRYHGGNPEKSRKKA